MDKLRRPCPADSLMIKPNNTEDFYIIAGRLKSELSLLTDEEYYRGVLKESYDIYTYLQMEYHKGLDEIELTEHDLYLLDSIKDCLPHSFWVLNDLSEDLFVYSSLASLQKHSHKYVDDFVKALCKGGWDGKVKERFSFFESNEPSNRYHDNEGENDYDIESVIRTIETLQKGLSLAKMEEVLEELFLKQSHQNKTKIIRHLLSSNKTEYTPLWNRIMSDTWWDDELKPDLEKWWSSKEAACVVIERFPYDYVLEHQTELGQYDYFSLCNRLAREKGFIIDRSRLNCFEFFQILANNHIHIDDREADKLLFDGIKTWLLELHQKIRNNKSVNWGYYDRNAPRFIDQQDFQSLLMHRFNYKPSLYELPNTVRFAMNLCFIGNTHTVAKLIVWNQFLRSNMQSFSEENEGVTTKLEQVAEGIDDNRDRNWRRFIELAIETFPVERK